MKVSGKDMFKQRKENAPRIVGDTGHSTLRTEKTVQELRIEMS